MKMFLPPAFWHAPVWTFFLNVSSGPLWKITVATISNFISPDFTRVCYINTAITHLVTVDVALLTSYNRYLSCHQGGQRKHKSLQVWEILSRCYEIWKILRHASNQSSKWLPLPSLPVKMEFSLCFTRCGKCGPSSRSSVALCISSRYTLAPLSVSFKNIC